MQVLLNNGTGNNSWINATVGRPPNGTDILVCTLFLLICVPALILYATVEWVVITQFKKLKNRFNILVIALGVPDVTALMLYTFYSVPCTLLQYDITGSFLPPQFLGVISHLTFYLQVTHIAYIAANRLICMSMNSFEAYDQLYSNKVYAISIILLWLFSAGMVGFLAAFTCVSRYFYEHYYWGYNCSDERLGNIGSLLNSIIATSICVLVVSLSTGTWLRLRSRNNAISDSAVTPGRTRRRMERRVAMQFLFVAMILFWLQTSFYVIPAMGFGGTVTSLLIGMAYLALSGCNPFIYMVFNRMMRQEVATALGLTEEKHTTVSRTPVPSPSRSPAR